MTAPAPIITAAGLYDVEPEVYHQDPIFQAPSLSASIAKTILEKSPRHAWLKHPRLNPDHEPENKQTFDLGKASHALLLGKGEDFAVVDAPDWRTKAAQAQREDAYNAGRIPILAHQLETAEAMAKAARAQILRSEVAGCAFVNGKPEQMLVWQEGETWCRCLLDWLPNGGNVFPDYKTTGASANPEQWGQRTLFDIGAHIQAAFYRRGIRAVLGIENPHFVFVVQENEEPFALSAISLTPGALAMADKAVEMALARWRWCLSRNRWPGYPGRVAYVEMPPWMERKSLEREERELVTADDGEDLMRIAMDWQAPLSGDAA